MVNSWRILSVEMNQCSWLFGIGEGNGSRLSSPNVKKIQINCQDWCVIEIPYSHSVMSDSLWPQVLYSLWNSPGQNTGVGGLSLLRGIFPTQRLNPGLPHCSWILYQLCHKGSPGTLEWVAPPFSSRSSRPGNWTGVSCIAGGIFTNWAIRVDYNF